MPNVNQSSRSLTKKIKHGDKDALQMLHQRVFLKVYAYAFQVTGDKKLSQETIENAFLEVWEKRDQIPTNIPLETLIFLKVHYQCATHMENPPKSLDKYQLDRDSLTKAEIELHFLEVLGGMNEHQQAVFKMNRFEGLAIDEIAKKVGKEEKYVELLLTQALGILKDELGDDLKKIHQMHLLKFIMD